MRGGGWQCRNPLGSCERAVCECDLQFSKDSGTGSLAGVSHLYVELLIF